MYEVVALAQAVSAGMSFDISNLAYAIFGVAVGAFVAMWRVPTRLALIELRLGRIETQMKITYDLHG